MIGRKRKFTEKYELKICNDYFSKEKPGTSTLAKKYNCSPETISNVLRRNGYKLISKGRYRIYRKEQELQICDEYFSGEKPSTITLAKKWGCSSWTIKDIIIRNGYKLRGRGESSKGKHRSLFSEQWRRKMKEKASTPEAIQQSLKNGFGNNCYYENEFFPSLQERSCYIELKKLGFKIKHNFLNRFDFLINNKIVLEYHPYDLTNLTKEQYYIKRRKLLDNYGYKDLKLIVVKNIKEIKEKIFKTYNFLNKVNND